MTSKPKRGEIRLVRFPFTDLTSTKLRTAVKYPPLTVRRGVEAVVLYLDWDELQNEYPELEKEDIQQALAR